MRWERGGRECTGYTMALQQYTKKHYTAQTMGANHSSVAGQGPNHTTMRKTWYTTGRITILPTTCGPAGGEAGAAGVAGAVAGGAGAAGARASATGAGSAGKSACATTMCTAALHTITRINVPHQRGCFLPPASSDVPRPRWRGAGDVPMPWLGQRGHGQGGQRQWRL